MTVVVFLPGLNNDALVWRPVIEALPIGFEGIAIDLPPEPRLNKLVDKVAKRVPKDSLVVGHSFGGVVALGLAERHLDRLAGIVLVNTPSGTDSPERIANRLAGARQARDGAFEEMAMGNMSRVFHGSRANDPAVRAERLRGVRAYGAERYFAHSSAIVERLDRTEFLRTLDIPVLILAASHDLATPTDTQRDWASANGVAYSEVADTGHMLPAEEPGAVAQAITDWWEALDGRD